MADQGMSLGFHCKLGSQCALDEEEINSYNQNEYTNVLCLLEEHGIDVEQEVNTVLDAQTLLFEHLKLRESQPHIPMKIEPGGQESCVGFSCELGLECELNEEEINSYDQNEYIEILDLLKEHGIDVDQAKTVLDAQTLLFKHLKLKESHQKTTGTGDQTMVCYRLI